MPWEAKDSLVTDLTPWTSMPMWLSSGSKSCLKVSSSTATIWLVEFPSVDALVRPRYWPKLFEGGSLRSGAMRNARPSPAVSLFGR